MAIVISGNGIDMGNNPVSNASQVEVQQEQVSPFNGFKNYIINGGFDIWQRGTSGISSAQVYTADRWVVWGSGANTNWSRASSTDFTPYDKFVGRGLKWNGGAASIASPIEHRIEGINAYKLSGKKVTVSFLAKCSSNSSINVELATPNGLDNYSAYTGLYFNSVSLTTTTQKFSVTFDLTNNDVRNGLSLIIRPSVSSATHWITNVQLEEGSVATPFENRPIGLELSLCQRYYQKTFAYGVVPTNGSTVSTIADSSNGIVAICTHRTLLDGLSKISILFPVEMRIKPTIQKYGNSDGNWKIVSSELNGFNPNIIVTSGTKGLNIMNEASVGTYTPIAFGHYTADAEL